MLFHLTVNQKGVVSLWDTEQKARTQEDDETYLSLQLTEEQQDAIRKARAEAKVKKLAKKVRGASNRCPATNSSGQQCTLERYHDASMMAMPHNFEPKETA
jgi:hypothetical protein